MNSHCGGCHSRNLRYTLETAMALDALPLRACQCSFCLRHGALSTSDPLGQVSFQFRDSQRLIRYRFAQRTADFLICGVCGIYVGAQLTDGQSSWAIINANTLDEASKLKQAVTPMDYDAENESQRIARRKSRWTPVVG